MRIGCTASPLEGNVSGHRFKIGQLVIYLNRDATSGVYRVAQLLPLEGEAFQYRIKNTNEPHERMAKERELSSAISDAPTVES
jgi:hypothetical protein